MELYSKEKGTKCKDKATSCLRGWGWGNEWKFKLPLVNNMNRISLFCQRRIRLQTHCDGVALTASVQDVPAIVNHQLCQGICGVCVCARVHVCVCVCPCV